VNATVHVHGVDLQQGGAIGAAAADELRRQMVVHYSNSGLV
jgi:hypothetical protein